MMHEDIKQAAIIIKHGGVVAFPTETVYGLGADARSDDACAKIFQLKGRPSFNPLIVHVASLTQAEAIAEFNSDAIKLAEELWSGPLTIVLPVRQEAKIAKTVLAGLDTIAIRMPAHPIALALLRESGCPLAAPSANPSGYISATTAEHVRKHFGELGVFILEGNDQCHYGLESTIIDLSSNEPRILRHGFITQGTLETVLGKKVAISPALMQIKAPGMMEKHYAPKTRLRLNAESLEEGEIGLNFGNPTLFGNYALNLSESADLSEAASNLYAMLRLLDEYATEHNIQAIAVGSIPNHGIALAINDRLKRAAAGS